MAPLHLAVQANDKDMVKLLISKYAELNCKNLRGQTPLHLACVNCNLDIVKLLTKHTLEIFIEA